MEKIYGYKQKDVEGLAQFLKMDKSRTLSESFAKYASKSGKAKGTVRNLYYALAKKSQTDKDFCNKYLDGKPLSVSVIAPFNEEDEKNLIKEILIAKENGKSVRGTIMEMASGDGKVALRYQNKFRNALTNKPHVIAQVVKELKDEGKAITVNEEQKGQFEISDLQLKRVKDEINNLVIKISAKEKKENQLLRERISILEKENLRLSTLLYAGKSSNRTMKFFKNDDQTGILN